METTPTTMETIAETVVETMETVAETVAETIAETVPEATQVIEAAETIDYTGMLTALLSTNQNIETLLGYLLSFALFFVVVCLCYFCYKFFKIFF